jgi:hypothetical protein
MTTKTERGWNVRGDGQDVPEHSVAASLETL